MMRFSTLWVSLSILFLSGCAFKEYTRSEPKHITLKTQKLRFSDLGYIRHDGDAVQVELFSAGHAVEQFDINHLICLSEGCITKSSFNSDYLYPDYPDELLRHVLLGQRIYEGENVQKTPAGFEQHIERPGIMIVYRVSADEIYFKDRIQKVMIRIRDFGQ